MSRNLVFLVLTAACLVLASGVQAQSGSVNGQSSGQASSTTGSTSAQTKSSASGSTTLVPGGTTADASAGVSTTVKAEQDIAAIRDKGSKTSAKARADAETKLLTTATSVESEAQKQGESKLATRLATEFGVTAEALTAEKEELKVGWGEVVIAHTLVANSKTTVTLAQLVQMHQDGTGWGQIAAGLGLKLGDVVSAVRTEGRVATGAAKADGKVAVIHADGARTNADARTSAGVRNGQTQAGLGIGLNKINK